MSTAVAVNQRPSTLLLALVMAVTISALLALVGPVRVGATMPGLNGRIAFNQSQTGLDTNIFTMNPDGTDQRQLTFQAGPPDSSAQAAWSPDGLKIAFISRRDGEADGIFVMDADGSDQTRLTTATTVDAWPTWSPDGRRIAFMHATDTAHATIHVMDADGSNTTQLTTGSQLDTDPTWSPDGRSIVFASNRDGNFELYVIGVDGAGETRLTDTSEADERVPDWSPDGSRIAYNGTASHDVEVFVMDADGSNVRNLTNSAGADGNPAWSPDGGFIAFATARNGNWDVYVMNADGSNQQPVATNPWADYLPDWQPLDYPFGGFYAPIDSLPAINQMQAGRAVPVKFSLGGDRGLAILAAGYPKSQSVACETSAPIDGVEETLTAGASSLIYDAAAGQYTYVWKTEKVWARTCRVLIVMLNDGTEHRASFAFTK